MDGADASVLVWSYVLVLSRVGGFLSMLPVPGSFGVPTSVKASLAIMLSFIVSLSFVPTAEPVKDIIGQLLVVGSEAILGLLVGFCFRLVFTVFQLAGQLISIQMGLGFAVLVDPKSSSQISLVSHYLYLVAALVFLAIDGHLLLISMMIESFRVVPLGGVSLDLGWKVIVEWAGVVFWGALWVALPILIALLLANVGFGVITRSTPQLNIFAIGFPVTLLLGLFGLIYMTPTIGSQVELLVARAFDAAGSVMVAGIR